MQEWYIHNQGCTSQYLVMPTAGGHFSSVSVGQGRHPQREELVSRKKSFTTNGGSTSGLLSQSERASGSVSIDSFNWLQRCKWEKTNPLLSGHMFLWVHVQSLSRTTVEAGQRWEDDITRFAICVSRHVCVCLCVSLFQPEGQEAKCNAASLRSFSGPTVTWLQRTTGCVHFRWMEPLKLPSHPTIH